jgi:hypothetical protein
MKGIRAGSLATGQPRSSKRFASKAVISCGGGLFGFRFAALFLKRGYWQVSALNSQKTSSTISSSMLAES